ncbi:MAG: PilZ domain-containing protein [Planctomycetes bacterium]|nr:PilZ domain-containing protein [Planctomycetota bacterium]
MENQDASRTSTDNRRRAERRESDAEIRITTEPTTLTGRAENVSAAGVFFFSPDPIRVRVEVIENGNTKSFTGRLVRLESFSANNNGFAIEFDRA